MKDWHKVGKGTDNGTFFLVPVHCSDGVANVPMAGGDGSENDPFQISTVAQLESIQDKPRDLYYVLNNDIDLAGIEWEPMSTFRGVLDGQGHSIKNMTITQLPDDVFERSPYQVVAYIGLFQDIDWKYSTSWQPDYTSIQNLNLEDVDISIDLADYGKPIELYVGALVASTQDYSTAPNGTLDNCTVSGSISINDNSKNSLHLNVGGLIGYAGREYCSIASCTSDIAITVHSDDTTYTKYVGGLVGHNGYLHSCTSLSNITLSGAAQIYCKGIVGDTGYNDLYNCIDNGTVTRK